MVDRYSLSDRQVYGAEDDFEMDLILDAIDRSLASESPRPPQAIEPCNKTPFRTQAEARTALSRWQEAKPGDTAVPHRVYPCDRCDAWHLTRKRSGRKVLPWDKDPDWERSATQLAKLEQRFGDSDSNSGL